MYWESLRKTYTIVDVGREHTTDTLFADNIRLRVDDDARVLDVSVDLNKSLRSRAKGVSTYIDAKGLADDGLHDFKSITIHDRGIIDRIGTVLKFLEFDVPELWRLHVTLRGDYWFTVRPEYKHQSLTFRVESMLAEHPPR